MRSFTKLTTICLALVFLAWVIYFFVLVCLFKGDWTKLGQFGDMFGALNTLFTGSAFVVVLVTLFQQSKQIEDMETKLKDERDAQLKTESLLNKQVEALSLTAHLNALRARIDGYTAQIEIYKTDQELTQRLINERHALLFKLDEVLGSYK